MEGSGNLERRLSIDVLRKWNTNIITNYVFILNMSDPEGRQVSEG